jgi:hypothetical protein
MRSRDETPVTEAEQITDSTDVADIVDWDATSQPGSSERSGGVDRTIGLAVAGIILAAVLVGGLVVFVISRAG